MTRHSPFDEANKAYADYLRKLADMVERGECFDMTQSWSNEYTLLSGRPLRARITFSFLINHLVEDEPATHFAERVKEVENG